MENKKYVLNDIKWYVSSENVNEEFDLLVVPFIFNKDKTKIKTLNDNKIYATMSTNTNGTDTLDALYSRDGNVLDADNVICYFVGLSKSRERKVEKMFNYNTDYSAVVTKKQVDKLTNLYYKIKKEELLIASNNKKKKQEIEYLSKETRNF
ncbi:MAG: hypothetical protein E7359_04125 [Clostridiales bacterium]|nr:hypothetical protein [Clostridiales bacterium]